MLKSTWLNVQFEWNDFLELMLIKKKYARQGSNLQPSSPEPDALSIELRAHDEILPHGVLGCSDKKIWGKNR